MLSAPEHESAAFLTWLTLPVDALTPRPRLDEPAAAVVFLLVDPATEPRPSSGRRAPGVGA